MKERGFDPVTIAAEEERLAHFEAGLELCPLIEAAFAGVTLGPGVGLEEALAIDDYLDFETRAAYRARDEKLDWRKISFEKLCQYNSSFSFLDAAGARFHLPAYMICELNGEYGYGFAFSLTHVSGGSEQKYSLLTPDQRAVVRQFLQHMLKDRDSKIMRPEIERALKEYWL